MYLTIAPVTVVVNPINKNDKKTTHEINSNKLIFSLDNFAWVKQNTKNNKINKFSKEAISSVKEWLS